MTFKKYILPDQHIILKFVTQKVERGPKGKKKKKSCHDLEEWKLMKLNFVCLFFLTNVHWQHVGSCPPCLCVLNRAPAVHGPVVSFVKWRRLKQVGRPKREILRPRWPIFALSSFEMGWTWRGLEDFGFVPLSFHPLVASSASATESIPLSRLELLLS